MVRFEQPGEFDAPREVVVGQEQLHVVLEVAALDGVLVRLRHARVVRRGLHLEPADVHAGVAQALGPPPAQFDLLGERAVAAHGEHRLRCAVAPVQHDAAATISW